MGAMILNISANALGLGNAATPFGIRAMQELDKLNPHKGTATNCHGPVPGDQHLQRDPAADRRGRAAGLARLGRPGGHRADHPLRHHLLHRRPRSRPPSSISASPSRPRRTCPRGAGCGQRTAPGPPTRCAPSEGYPAWVSFLVLGGIASLVPLTIVYGREIAPWIIPVLVMGLLGFGMARRVAVYEVFVEGAKDGFQVALRIIPYLVAILVAVAMFRASGALEALVGTLGRVTSLIGLPAEALPMALLRPLSGSGAYGLLAATIQDPAIGPDSYTGYLVSTLQGSTETTFYVLAVYFGAVQIRRVRHAMAAGLTADLAGIIAAVFICSLLFT